VLESFLLGAPGFRELGKHVRPEAAHCAGPVFTAAAGTQPKGHVFLDHVEEFEGEGKDLRRFRIVVIKLACGGLRLEKRNPFENPGIKRKGLCEGVHELPEMGLQKAKPFVKIGGTLDLLAQKRGAVGVIGILGDSFAKAIPVAAWRLSIGAQC